MKAQDRKEPDEPHPASAEPSAAEEDLDIESLILFAMNLLNPDAFAPGCPFHVPTKEE